MRAAAERLDSPGDVLKRANETLCPDIPPNMFVTCLYAVLDPERGRLRYANAGHDRPYHRRDGGCDELRATGMPLGLMPGMTYEEKEVELRPGESVLCYSDGLVEAHNTDREMFGFPRLMELVKHHPGGPGADWSPVERAVQLYGHRMGARGRCHHGHPAATGWRVKEGLSE